MCFFVFVAFFLFWLGPDLVVSFLADGQPGCASFVPLLHMLILLVAASDLYFATEFRHKLVFSHLIWCRALSHSLALAVLLPFLGLHFVACLCGSSL